MKLQTEIKLKKKDDNLIDYHSKLLLYGSCFSDNIGDKLEYFKFQSISNPFGVLFHPKAIENSIASAVEERVYTEKDVFFNNEQWHCYDVHSKLSCNSKEKLIQNINTQIELTNKQIKASTHIFFTLGTAWIYDLIETKKTVANCHKMPQKYFNKRLLSIEEIVESLKNTIEAIKKINTRASIIFTVSPIRHIKDGFVENTQSKSHLITAIHQLEMNSLSYFPSYEIMLDELRDYRFYKQDMLHPNEIAIEYIWQKFEYVWIDSKTLSVMQAVELIQKGLRHKPFNKESNANIAFLKQLEVKKKEIQSQFAHIEF